MTKAEQFAADKSIALAYGSGKKRSVDIAIDVDKVAAATKQHAERIVMNIHAGKHVLCEKAITMNVVNFKSFF
ncbi:hypothetical protein QMZ09_09035 [Enterococcus faecalis]